MIPGFVGVGIIIQQVLKGQSRKGLREGGRLIIISLILFAIFGALIGGLLNFVTVAALVLIGLGLWQLMKVFVGRSKSN